MDNAPEKNIGNFRCGAVDNAPKKPLGPRKIAKILDQLIGMTDLIISNFRPGVDERLGFDFAHAQSINPDIIYLENVKAIILLQNSAILVFFANNKIYL